MLLPLACLLSSLRIGSRCIIEFKKGHELFTIVTFRSMMLECNIGILLELGRNSVLLCNLLDEKLALCCIKKLTKHAFI